MDWKAVTRPPTLADLAADPGELIAACRRCHHDAVLPVALAVARYGPTTPFPEVKGRFRCSACGSRQIDVRPNWSRQSPGQITCHTDRPAQRDR
jgi:hypothetical protein